MKSWEAIKLLLEGGYSVGCCDWPKSRQLGWNLPGDRIAVFWNSHLEDGPIPELDTRDLLKDWEVRDDRVKPWRLPKIGHEW